MPKVSVIISTYNDAALLPKALDGVLAQSFRDFELLVFNDASTDSTDLILKDYQKKDARVIIISNKAKLGLTVNLNLGITASLGQYIARLDSDDEWVDEKKLQKQLDFLQAHPACGLVGTWAEFTSIDNQKLYDFKPPAGDEQIRKELLLHNCFVHSSIMARKNLVLQAGSYNPTQPYVEDYGLWLHLGTMGELANLPEIMVRYRVNKNGITQTKNSRQIKAAIALIKEYKHNYPGYYKSIAKWRLQYFLSFLK